MERQPKERTKPIKVYAYTRVSTGMQVDAYSLDAQLSSIKKYCEYKGYEIVRLYSDRGISGKDIKHRIKFRQMMTDIANKKDGVSYVIVFKLSRFGRNTENVLNALKFLQSHEVALACSEENIDSSNEMSNFIITIMAAVAELERENILIQTQAGRRQKAIEGKWNGGPAPYGYSLINGKLEINEEQAPLIRRIFEIFTTTSYGIPKVANTCNEEGYRKDSMRKVDTSLLPTSSPITVHFVTKVLDNPVYAGFIAYGRRTVAPEKDSDSDIPLFQPKQANRIKQRDESKIIIEKGIHEAIIPLDVWNKARTKRAAAVSQPRRSEYIYTLSNLLKCPNCGSTLYGIVGSKKKGANGTTYSGYHYYACRNLKSAARGKICPKPYQIATARVEAEVESLLFSILNSPTTLTKIEEAVSRETDDKPLAEKLTQLNKSLSLTQTKINRFEKDEIDLDPTDPLYEKYRGKIERQLTMLYEESRKTETSIQETEEALEAAKEGRLNREAVKEMLSNYSALSQVITPTEKRDLLKRFIKSIELTPDKGKSSGKIVKRINFAFPIEVGGKLTESFPPKEKHDECVVLMSRVNK